MPLFNTLLTVVGVAFLIRAYLNYPAPKLSKNLNQWMTAGKYFKFGEHHIFYRDDTGSRPDAPTVVLLHGFPSSSYDWIKVWPALQEKFGRVIAPDFIGFGFSDKPYNHKYTIKEQADITEQLLKELKVQKVHILAHDYGDTVAQEILARYEERKRAGSDTTLELQSVCLTNGGIFPETNFPRLGQRILLTPYIGDVLSSLTNYYIFRRAFGEVFGPERWPTDEEFQDFWAAIRVNDGHLVAARILDYIRQRRENRERWLQALADATIPVHVVWGLADPVNPPGFVNHYKKLVPDSDVTVLKDAGIGHYPQWEAPGDTMQAYFNFLRNNVQYSKPEDP